MPVSLPTISNQGPLTIFAGINVLESRELALEVAHALKESCQLPLVFKASFDKANRTSHTSYRGPGMDKGLQILQEVKDTFQLPIITDFHEPYQAAPVAEVADVIQIPAFLSRQTDLLKAAAQTGAAINVKKAQFLAASDMHHPVDKLKAFGAKDVFICERGAQFGYHNLVVDFLGFDTMKSIAPLIFDVTHSLQLPGVGSGNNKAGGRGAQTAALAKSAVIQGIAGLFFECHPDPASAKCDGPSALPLNQVKQFMDEVQAVEALARQLQS